MTRPQSSQAKAHRGRPKPVDATALTDLARSVDANGTLASLPPAEWLVCFVPGLRREWWHRFAHPRHHHVFAMRPLDTDAISGRWLLVESWKHRLHVPVLPPSEAARFLRWASLGDILRVRELATACGAAWLRTEAGGAGPTGRA